MKGMIRVPPRTPGSTTVNSGEVVPEMMANDFWKAGAEIGTLTLMDGHGSVVGVIEKPSLGLRWRDLLCPN